MNRRLACLLALALALSAAGARGDIWDEGPGNDNDLSSRNEIVHGLDQVHDLVSQSGGTDRDEDYYRLQMKDGTSMEVVVDGLTGDLATPHPPAMRLLASDGITEVASAISDSPYGTAIALRFSAPATVPPGGETAYYVRVDLGACGLACTEDDKYRIRAVDTTLSMPRFNNSGTQTTFLILQNGDVAESAFGRIEGYGPTGTLLGSVPFGLLGGASLIYDTSSQFPGQAGALAIIHNGGYGRITGKAVALEPATGFTFDTPVVARPR